MPCHVLFIHRDADRTDHSVRCQQIEEAVIAARGNGFALPHVCVVPVRMTEAWLLLDDDAIRHAAGNPNGDVTLNLPPLLQVERIANPKQVLHELLCTASGLRPRRLRKLNPATRSRLIPQYMNDFSRLRKLTAFQCLEAHVRAMTTRIQAERE